MDMPNEVTWILWDKSWVSFFFSSASCVWTTESGEVHVFSAKFCESLTTLPQARHSLLTGPWGSWPRSSYIRLAGILQSQALARLPSLHHLWPSRENIDDHKTIRLASFIVVNVDDIRSWDTWWCLLLTPYHHIITIVVIINMNDWMVPWWQFVVSRSGCYKVSTYSWYRAFLFITLK